MAVLVATAAAGCGTVHSPGEPAGPGLTTRTAPPTTATTAKSPSTSTSIVEANAPRCALAQLRVSVPMVGHGAGQVLAYLTFQNVGQAPCNIEGYPGVAGLDASGGQIAEAARVPDPAGPSLATVGPSQSASAGVYTDQNQIGATPCQSIPALLVTPPNSASSVRVSAYFRGAPETLSACQPLSVGPVFAGTNAGWPTD